MLTNQIASQFDVSGQVAAVEPLGAGNINDTYQVSLDNGDAFILQKINRLVFTDPAAVMDNIQLVTKFARTKISADTLNDRTWQVTQVIKSIDHQLFVKDTQGEYWRALTMIKETRSYEHVETTEVAYQAGKTLGHFHRVIADCPIESLNDTLPGFHITPNYLTEYDKVLASETLRRLNSTTEKLGRLIESHRDQMSVLENAKHSGELVLRVIHGDPKISNILFEKQNNLGISIIDLDTVKPGLIHYDFGDAVRSICNPAGEETKDPSEVVFDLNLFTSFYAGFMSEAKAFLNERDYAYLYDSIKVITFELGLRFLTDYLAGDRYFKIDYEAHNLNRARAQFALLESITDHEKDIQTVVGELK